MSDAARPAITPAPAPAQTAAEEGNALAGDADRMIARTADVSMIVADTEPAMQAITALVAASGGYIADSKAWRERGSGARPGIGAFPR